VPRKLSGVKRTKVVSTKIPDSEYTLIDHYAKEYYLQGNIRQPNTSQLLSYIITDWLDTMGKIEEAGTRASADGIVQL
jgi:hypothetical protein